MSARGYYQNMQRGYGGGGGGGGGYHRGAGRGPGGGGGGPWRGRGRGRGDYRQHQEHQQREVVRGHPNARNGNCDVPKSQSGPAVNGSQPDQPARTFEEASAEIQVPSQC